MNYNTNSFLNLLDLFYSFLIKTISTSSMRIRMSLRNVSYGKNIYFFGLTIIKKHSNGRISIAENCVFRSLATSNLIGINRPCILSVLTASANLKIGEGCGFSGTVIGCFDKIEFGKNVRCGANTLITDSDWHLNDFRSGKPKPISIGDNVWLGVNVTVMKGVTIGENSIIGAGSVVTKNIPANVIAAGNPCHIIKDLILTNENK